jgi:hypothetical protein
VDGKRRSAPANFGSALNLASESGDLLGVLVSLGDAPANI